MFEEVLPKETINLVNILSTKLNDFYLAGGTGLALQLGHRKSQDLKDPSPILIIKSKERQWKKVKNIFKQNIKIFEKHLI